MSDSCASQGESATSATNFHRSGKTKWPCEKSFDRVDRSNPEEWCEGYSTTRSGQKIICKVCIALRRCNEANANLNSIDLAEPRMPFEIQFAADNEEIKFVADEEEISPEILDAQHAQEASPVNAKPKQFILRSAMKKQQGFILLNAIKNEQVSFQERLAEHEHRRAYPHKHGRLVQILHAFAESILL
jgi:hypothetical protein